MLKSENLVLHAEFLQRLRALPQSYAYGEYRQIFQDYGTHYITEAALGGDFEYTIILDKERLEKSGDLTQSTSVPFKGVRGNVTLWSQGLELCFPRLLFGGLQKVHPGGPKGRRQHFWRLRVRRRSRRLMQRPAERDGR